MHTLDHGPSRARRQPRPGRPRRRALLPQTSGAGPIVGTWPVEAQRPWPRSRRGPRPAPGSNGCPVAGGPHPLPRSGPPRGEACQALPAGPSIRRTAVAASNKETRRPLAHPLTHPDNGRGSYIGAGLGSLRSAPRLNLRTSPSPSSIRSETQGDPVVSPGQGELPRALCE